MATCISLLAAVPAHAGNGTVSRSVDGSTITLTFTDAGDSILVSSTGSFPNGNIVVAENSGAGTTITPAPNSGCSSVGEDVSCPRVHNAVAAQRVVVEFNGGDDFDEVTQLTNIDITLDLRGGAGADTLWGSARGDVIDGGSGDDVVEGFRGNDALNGGSGNDFLDGAQGSDDLSGGDGFDHADTVNADVPSGVTVTLDDVANDGTAGEGDNVRSDVEDLTGTAHADVLIGSDRSNILTGLGGNDSLDGRGGADQLVGGDADDSVAARDGVGDRIDCGAGTDSLTADSIDESTGCEQEDRSSALESSSTDSDGDGSARPADCDDGNAGVRPGAAEVPDNGVDDDCNGTDATVLDRDGDGVNRPADCHDGNAAVRPGAREVPGNALDENCDGIARPFPDIASRIVAAWAVRGGTTRPRALSIRSLPAGATVRLACRGRGCPFKTRTRRVRRATRSLGLLALVRGMTLRPGARFEVTVTAPETVGKVARFTTRRGSNPRAVALCLPPGSRTAREC